MVDFLYCLLFTVLIIFDNFIFSSSALETDLEFHNQTVVVENELRSLPPHHYGVNFYAYTDPQNPETRHEIKIGDKQSLNNAGLITGVAIEVYAHGFGGSDTEPTWTDLKLAFFRNGFRNVILVRWENIKPVIGDTFQLTSYPAAIKKYLPEACDKLTAFVSFLIENGYTLNQFHLLGHSLGAHLVGCVGKLFYTKYNKLLPRITGMDPAGPFRQIMPAQHKLSSESAVFVDVYHSDIDGFGMPEPIGHVDFYINGGKGKSQTGCNYKLPPVVSFLLTIACSHPRALQVFAYTVYKNITLLGYPCQGENKIMPCKKPAVMDKKEAIKAGEYINQSAKGKYYLQTTESDIKAMRRIGVRVPDSMV